MGRVLAIALRLLGILVLCVIIGFFTLPKFLPWMLLVLGFGFWGAVMHYIGLLPSRGRSADSANLRKEMHRIERLLKPMQDRADCEWAVRASRWHLNELETHTMTGRALGTKNTPTIDKFPPYRFPDPPLWPTHIKRTLRHPKEKSFQPASLIVVEGDSGSGFYFLLRGCAKIVQEGEEIAELKEGTFFSESSFLDKIPVPIRIMACDKTVCLVLSPWEFDYILNHYPPSETLIQTPS